ncbi:MAG: DeoR family transcriptional regulator [Candidatus Pacebacteria bacterium]|nr:DeoR family transcriptional regulator [Candidatus Paceibacterota bacterium]
MDREKLVKLTNEVYRLTLFFPKKDPLRYRLRDVAVSFLACPNQKDLEILESFFEVVLAQNWVGVNEVLSLKGEYNILKCDMDIVAAVKLPSIIHKPIAGESSSGLPERQERILNFLKENGRAQVWQVKQILPEVTKRTLRRDFENLLNQGVIERLGERNTTFYQLKTEVS